MSPTFSARTVANFESAASGFAQTSTLTEFQDGTFGPYDELDTITNSFNVSAQAQVGDRINAILAMQADGYPLIDSDFTQLSEQSMLLASPYIEGAQELQVNRQIEISWVQTWVLPIFISTQVIYSLSVICLVVSIYIIACILKTQQRKYKNVAHITWVSTFIMLIVGSLSACFFTIVSLLTDDHCTILDYTEEQKSVAGVPHLYPASLVPIMNTCLFGDVKNASIDL